MGRPSPREKSRKTKSGHLIDLLLLTVREDPTKAAIPED